MTPAALTAALRSLTARLHDGDRVSRDDARDTIAGARLTVPQLRDVCTALNLRATGTKPELVERLVEHSVGRLADSYAITGRN